MVLLTHQLVTQLAIAKRQIAQAGIAQRALADVRMFNAIAVEFIGVVHRQTLVRQLGSQRAGQRFAHCGNGDRINDLKQFSNFAGGWQSQNFRGQRRINLLIQQNSAERVGHVNRQRQRLTLLMTSHVQLNVGCQQALRGVPTREIITRMAHQEGELLIAPFIFQLHRRGEFTQQRRHRLEVNVIEHKRLLGLGHV